MYLCEATQRGVGGDVCMEARYMGGFMEGERGGGRFVMVWNPALPVN